MSFNDIYTQLSQLRLSIYAPLDKVFESRRAHYEDLYDTDVEGGRGKLQQKDRERALQSLMTTNLLKRLESSIESFRITLRLLLGNHDTALAKIAAFQTNLTHPNNQAPGTVQDYTDLLEGLEGDDDDFPVPDAEKTSGKVQVRLADMDLPTWRRELQADRDIIAALLADMLKVVPADDAKLQHLQALIADKIARPINSGNKKVIVFTAFADTAAYLYQQLAPALLRDQGLHSALVTGKDAPKNNLKPGHSFQTLLTLFSPRAKEKALVLPHEHGEIDLLIATDCISEGQNLQDCDFLINYDIHWNPVRIIQRFGRVDRIGSINAEIQLVNYWPDISLDAYIGLKERVENRMVIADVTATGDDNPLSAQANDVSYRKEQLRRLQEEVIDLEDLKTGVNITDLGLNDFRMDLLHHIQTKENLAQLPHGLHAVVPARPALGLHPGVIFALRNRNPQIDLRQLNRLHPFYLCYMGMDGRLITGYAEVKQLLDLARAACKGLDSPLLHLCHSFNAETRDGRDMRRYAALLSQAIHTMIEVKADRDIDSLFTSHQTSALRDQIAGLDEFELIAFLVIREEKA
jgi:Helicase conserved C-terminal domain